MDTEIKDSKADIQTVDDISGVYKTGSLRDIFAEQITDSLGFNPNVKDDPDKVVNSWAFTYNGKRCAIWDYKGSEKDGVFSTFGPEDAFKAIFPTNYEAPL